MILTCAALGLERINDEVYVSNDPYARIGANHMEFIKQQARSSARGRARICAHRTSDDSLHEMLIGVTEASYIRPHRHLGKAESFHIVEGAVDVVVFDQTGQVVEVVELGAPASGRDFFYRMSDSLFHTLVLRTPLLVVHEVTTGPLRREQTEYGAFSPDETETEAVGHYNARVRDAASRFCATIQR